MQEKGETMSRLVLVLVMLLCFGAPQVALAQAPDTPAREAIIVDAGTGAILFQKNADARMPTSSMSKTMTMYMVFEALKSGALKLTDELPVSEKAWRMGGSKMFIEVGKRIKVEDLIRGVIIQSGNDAAVVLAEALGGTEENFATLMTARAKEIGLANSHFTNATGWPDPEHYSTPKDLAVLGQRLIRDFPEHYHYYSEKEFVFNNIRQANRNPLLSKGVPGVDGIKTGHAEEAGYGMIASAIRDGRRLIMVVNGLANEKAREEESSRLLEWAFAAFENVTLYKPGDTVEQATVFMGEAGSVPLTVDGEVGVTIARADRSALKVKAVYESPVEAPVKQGQEIGKLVIERPDAAPEEYKLLAGASVPRLGLWGRMLYKFNHLIGRGEE